MLLPVRTRVPPPAWNTLPVPDMSLATGMRSERLTNNAPLFTTAPVPSVPVVPPVPMISKPAVMVVVPE